jgi:hypothetical protein
LLEFPALEKRGAPIDRIVQPRGNAFYNIGKREGRKLRVETPYLVGVIKGTQFNVAVQDESATISLFEGSLEVHAADESGLVDLKAGEIASRRRGEQSIGVIKMDAKAPFPGQHAPAGSRSNNATPSPDQSLFVDRAPDSASADLDIGADLLTDRALVDVDLVPARPGVTVDTGSKGADLETAFGADVVADNVDLTPGTAVDAGSVPTVIDTPSTAGADAGPLPTDISATPGIDVDLGLDADLEVDDGNNGHGNDDDHSDSGNPGGGKHRDRTQDDVGGFLNTDVRRPGRK